MILVALYMLTALHPTITQSAPVIISADGSTQPYTAFSSALGAAAVEVPDCGHATFGDHITQQHDPQLARYVFAFHIHVDEDDDRCLPDVTDRQRIEVKAYDKSSAYLRVGQGETASYSWNLKLPSGLRLSRDFTHIHQIKFVSGNSDQPLYTITLAAKGSTNVLRYQHVDDKDVKTILAEVPVAPFIDQWVHVYERIDLSTKGAVFIDIRRVSDGQPLLTYSGSDLENWRTGSDFARPKWGVYRSLKSREEFELRDETLLLDRVCLAKGLADDCERA